MVVLCTLVPLRALDATAGPPVQVLDLLRALPIFAPLSQPVLERLALTPRSSSARPGELLQGDPGDRFYVIAAGRGGDGRRRARAHGVARRRVRRDRAAARHAAHRHGDRDDPGDALRARPRRVHRGRHGPPASAEAAEALATARLATAGPVR